MARQPKQVHIYLFRKRNNQWEYLIFHRADMPGCWQGVCGGLENEETPEEGARRELFEEVGVTDSLPLHPLESISYLPDNIFSPKARALWGKQTVVVPMYFFAMPFSGEVTLSHEHSEVCWLPYEEAHNLIYFNDQKVALYELNEKLLRGLIPE